MSHRGTEDTDTMSILKAAQPGVTGIDDYPGATLPRVAPGPRSACRGTSLRKRRRACQADLPPPGSTAETRDLLNGFSLVMTPRVTDYLPPARSMNVPVA
jgi:hypothetical protein